MFTRVSRLVAVVAAATVLAACGSKASNQAAAVTTTTGTTAVAAAGAATGGATTTTVAGQNGQGGQRGQQQQAWRDCLSQHGVTLPAFAPRQNGQGGTGSTVAGGQDPNGGPPPSDGGPLPGAQTPPVTDASGNPVPGKGPGRVGGPGGGPFTSILADPANKAAVDACASLQPQGGFGGGGNGQRGGQAFQAYLSCLKDNGVDVATTVAGGPPASIDRSAPAYAAANTKCQVLLPQRQGGDVSTTTTTVGG